MARVSWISIIIAGFLALGCTSQRPGDQPRVRYGTDVCIQCGMIVSEERFAAGYVNQEGASVLFDDLGELLSVVVTHPELAAVSFVHDAEQGNWMKATAACFIFIPGFPTPMGSGIAAFSGVDRAEAFARRLGANATILKLGEAVTPQAVTTTPHTASGQMGHR